MYVKNIASHVLLIMLSSQPLNNQSHDMLG
jgi:hypothetical protein